MARLLNMASFGFNTKLVIAKERPRPPRRRGRYVATVAGIEHSLTSGIVTNLFSVATRYSPKIDSLIQFPL